LPKPSEFQRKRRFAYAAKRLFVELIKRYPWWFVPERIRQLPLSSFWNWPSFLPVVLNHT
jgi:hypothetical protein